MTYPYRKQTVYDFDLRGHSFRIRPAGDGMYWVSMTDLDYMVDGLIKKEDGEYVWAEGTGDEFDEERTDLSSDILELINSSPKPWE